MIRPLSLLSLLLLLAACGESHDADSGRDSGSDAILTCDAGPAATCQRGPCCEDAVGACGAECPTGYSATCTPDPAALCADGLRDCTQPSDCVVADMQCCGPCVRTLENTTAVRGDRLVDYFDEGTECATVDCAACPSLEPTDSRIAATCNVNLCEAVAIRPSALTACTEDDQCRVRALECCECGADLNSYNLASVRSDAEGAITGLLCDADTACNECAPDYSGFVAFCADDGHCAFGPADS